MKEGFLRSIILAVAAYGIGAGEACAQAQGLAAVRSADPGSKFPQLIVFPTNFSNEFFCWSTTTAFNLPTTASILPATAAPAPTPVVSLLGKDPGGGRGTTTAEVPLIIALEGAFGPPGTVADGQR